MGVLNGAIVIRLRQTMKFTTTTNYESRWVRWLRKELSQGARVVGKAEGRQDALLAVLKSRALTLTPKQKATILGCSDEATLDGWLARCSAVASVDELLSAAHTQKAKPSRPATSAPWRASSAPKRAPRASA